MTQPRPGDIFQPGDLLNNTYRIEAILGRGGTSEVYRARSDISGRVVALKALRSEFSANEDYLVLMRREEEIRDIRHDAIVRYSDNQRMDDGRVYLVMDYVDGPGLDALMRDGGMSAADLLTVCRRVCEGLVAAHDKGIVHRDLSPDNIILRDGDPGQAVIIDFGIAKDANPGAQTIVGGEFAGKYAYAAPEQLAGHSDARSDIYALGALLLATFRGRTPDVGDNPMQVVEAKARPPHTDGVPQPLRGLIEAMTRPDPADRLQSAQAILDEIDAAGRPGRQPATTMADGDATVIAPQPSRTPSAAAVAPPRDGRSLDAGAPPSHVPSAAPDRTPGSRRGLAAVLGLAVVAVALGGAYAVGIFEAVTGPRHPLADPFAIVVERPVDGEVAARGVVPSAEVEQALAERVLPLGGTMDVALASGDIPDGWGDGLLTLVDGVVMLPEWRVSLRGDVYAVTGLTEDSELDRALPQVVLALPAGLSGTVEIDLGPRILPPERLLPILRDHADCGELFLRDPPQVGYAAGEEISVGGQVASTATRVALIDALSQVAGDRPVAVDAEVLNATLCLVDDALPLAPSGGFDTRFGFGDRDDPNPQGRYFVGENPVIDVTVPADVTEGYLYVSALDVSGDVFHMLPNLNRPDNAVAALRDGRDGAVDVRVAYPLSEQDDGRNLAFTVDDSALGKTEILVLHADAPLFDELRPTAELAEGYARALRETTQPIRTLDSRILTTALP